jgi:hypothetical protein
MNIRNKSSEILHSIYVIRRLRAAPLEVGGVRLEAAIQEKGARSR